MKLKHFLTPHTKINSKWIKDLNVRLETIKLLEKNIGRTLDDINQSKILYDPPPRVMEIKPKANSSVQSLSQASLSITNSQSLLKLMSIELVMSSNHLILCCPLYRLPSIFPSKGSFPLSQLFTSGGQISASASVLPMNIQD